MNQRQLRSTVGLLAVAAVAASGCSFMSPQVQSKERSQVQAQDANVGLVKVRSAYLSEPTASDAAQTGTPSTSTYLTMTIVNESASTDELTGITAPDGTVTLSGGPVRLLPGVLVTFGNPVAGISGPTAVYTPSGAAPALGTSVAMTYSFTTAGSSVLSVPVVNDNFTYAATSPVPTTQATMAPQEDLPKAD